MAIIATYDNSNSFGVDMSEFFLEYGMFLLKSVTVLVVILMIMGFSMSRKKSEEGELKVVSLNEKFSQLKLEKKKQKEAAKNKKEVTTRKRVFVIDFEGDIKASSVPSLREEITAILSAAKKGDEVLVNLNNSGGVVHEHGFAASQLVRIKDAKLNSLGR